MGMFDKLGSAIEGFRLARGYKKKTHLGRAMGKPSPENWARNRLSKYENGRVAIPITELGEILEFLEVELTDVGTFLKADPSAMVDPERLARQILDEAPDRLKEAHARGVITEAMEGLVKQLAEDPEMKMALESILEGRSGEESSESGRG